MQFVANMQHRQAMHDLSVLRGRGVSVDDGEIVWLFDRRVRIGAAHEEQFFARRLHGVRGAREAGRVLRLHAQALRERLPIPGRLRRQENRDAAWLTPFRVRGGIPASAEILNRGKEEANYGRRDHHAAKSP